ncbi:MAG: M3 family oligoendopeptidase [Erysipelotrichaceae bacterium]|nr:M3 family oligoendopeptidase [Erysipelotrichaceae bacterium]MDY5251328.1 M3 family oligoendopeptidase [Erysipelotrichaceae bacterium]
MKFKDLKYERIDLAKTCEQLENLAKRLQEAQDATTFKAIFQEICQLQMHIDTMGNLVSVRHSINTADEFYNEENDWWDMQRPVLQKYFTDIANIAISKPYREELLDEIYEPYFKIAECKARSFNEAIIPLLQQENKLISEYGKLKASAKIEFDGKECNLAQIAAYCSSQDRDIRKKAFDAKMRFYQDNEAKFDEIYDQLVHVRHQIALKLGYDNFIQVGYDRMLRLDYDAKMVSKYRDMIAKHVVPLAQEIVDAQANRINVDKVRYYDYDYEFLSGNPKPVESYDEKIAAAKWMYHQMSKETAEFIDVMIDNELWDLESKPNKELGGYCTEFPEYKLPFIFSNFNGTRGDVEVLTHEAGHALNSYLAAKDINVPECVFPTLESCEIHSMSMEFFTYPYMHKFFGDDTQKYYYAHFSNVFKFLPYGVLVDHFQHEIYANPDMTPAQRKETWRKLERRYTPFKDYEGNEMLEKGCWWYQQGHIFASPFYYIDYTLAQVCALQFWDRMYNQDDKAWHDYIKLCRLGGTKTFLQLVEEANLRSPFDDECLLATIEDAKAYLKTFDLAKF